MPEHCVLLRLKLSHRKLFLAWKAAPARRRRGAHTSRVCGDASVATAPATGVYMLAAVHYGWLGRYIERMYACMLYSFRNENKLFMKFYLHATWIQDVRSTQIFVGCHLRFFRVASTQIFFQGAHLIFFWFISMTTNFFQAATLKKSG